MTQGRGDVETQDSANSDSANNPESVGQLTDIFVSLADTLVDDYDVVELMERLAQACVELLNATSAGLMIIDQRGSLQVVASSSQEMHLLELFQIQSDEGPCRDCVRTGAPVGAADLVRETSRWPAFAPAAIEAGFTALQALPLRLRSETIGALNLFFAGRPLLDEPDLRVAQALADVATIGILQQRAVHRGAVLAEQLQRALNSRIVIEQAKGVIAEHAKLGMDQAFEVLRKHARDHNLKLSDLAAAVSRGDISPSQLPTRSSG
jgi:transcriptional regulator with GAF, ATPase, and Fis domain